MRSKLLLGLLLSAFAIPPRRRRLRGHGGPVRAVAVSADGKSGDLRQLRHLGDPLVARAQRRRAGAALPRKRGQRGRDPARRTARHRRRGRHASRSGSRASPRPAQCSKATPRRSCRSRCRRTATRSPPPPGTAPSGSGRSRAARRACSRAIRRTSTASRSRRDGQALVSAGYDATVRIWPLAGSAIAGHRHLADARSMRWRSRPTARSSAAGADGRVYFVSAGGEQARRSRRPARSPIISLAVSPDGALVAAAGIRGSVAIIERKSRKHRAHAGRTRACRSGRSRSFPTARRCSPAAPTALVRRWDARDRRAYRRGAASPATTIRSRPMPAIAAPRSFAPASPATRLSPDEGNRAGPTLAGIFGRRIATLPGYNFSDALKKLDIVWTPETVSKLFEVGPAAYTPGTKMPEQQIGSAEDRKALVEFLEKATTKQRSDRAQLRSLTARLRRARADNPRSCADRAAPGAP